MGTVTKQQKKVPALRFIEFSDVYSSTTVSSVAKKLSVGFVGTCEKYYTDKNSGVPIIRTGNLQGEKLVMSDLKFVNKDFHEKNIKSKVFENDILIARHGTNGQAVLNNYQGEANTLNIVILRTNEDTVVPGYMVRLLNSENVRRQASAVSAGSTQSVINTKAVGELKIFLPTKLEQQKIADFLGLVDAWLDNLRQQKTAVETYKLGMMQKLFTQQVRFKNDNGKDYPEWQEKKLSDVSVKSNTGVAAGSLEGNDGEYAVYGASGLYKHVDFYQEEEPYITIIKDGSGVGRTSICPGKSSVIGTLNVIRATTGNELYFVYLLLTRLNLIKYVIGGAIPHIYYKDYKREKVMVPSLPEQQKIADFFTALDGIISAKVEEITKVEQWKNGLMQKMFI